MEGMDARLEQEGELLHDCGFAALTRLGRSAGWRGNPAGRSVEKGRSDHKKLTHPACQS
jgi:hypothetical protein